MAERTVEAVRQLVSWDEFRAAYERSEFRLEYIDGEIVNPGPPTGRHQQAVFGLAMQLLAGAPRDYVVLPAGVAWRPEPQQELGPDILVGPDTGEQGAYTGRPVLLVEVLSSNKANDYIRKTAVYARYGVPHYWILDPVEASLDIFRLQPDGSYGLPVGTQTASDGPVELDAGFGPVTVDLSALVSR